MYSHRSRFTLPIQSCISRIYNTCSGTFIWSAVKWLISQFVASLIILWSVHKMFCGAIHTPMSNTCVRAHCVHLISSFMLFVCLVFVVVAFKLFIWRFLLLCVSSFCWKPLQLQYRCVLPAINVSGQWALVSDHKAPSILLSYIVFVFLHTLIRLHTAALDTKTQAYCECVCVCVSRIPINRNNIH